MGLFDNIKKTISAAGEDFTEAYEWAMAQDIMDLHKAMKETKLTEVVKVNGYKAAFREKCQPLDNKTLKQLHKEVNRGFSLKTNHASEIIEDILVQRGVFSRDKDGTILEF